MSLTPTAGGAGGRWPSRPALSQRKLPCTSHTHPRCPHVGTLPPSLSWQTSPALHPWITEVGPLLPAPGLNPALPLSMRWADRRRPAHTAVSECAVSVRKRTLGRAAPNPHGTIQTRCSVCLQGRKMGTGRPDRGPEAIWKAAPKCLRWCLWGAEPRPVFLTVFHVAGFSSFLKWEYIDLRYLKRENQIEN